MLSREKITVRIHLFFRNLFYHLIFWIACLLFYVFLTGNNQLFKDHFNILEGNSIYLITLFLALGITLLFTIFDSIIGYRVLRFFPIRMMVFLRTFLYFILAFLVLVLASQNPVTIFSSSSFRELLTFMPEMNTDFFRFMVYFFLACFANNFFKEMVKKVGRGNFRNWFFGLLNKPGEEERIFMFIDMKSSTTIAEKLRHRKYSHLCQDIFNDLAVVDNYHGEIYQYLGDGAIVTWNIKRGLENNNFLNAFFAYISLINNRSRYYQRKYDVVPQFKAGVHTGKVMVLQVGRIRSDISYNGDTLNTAARIESMCNEYRQNLLISGELCSLMKDKGNYIIKNIGNIKLKGKRKGVEIYSVKFPDIKKKKKKLPMEN